MSSTASSSVSPSPADSRQHSRDGAEYRPPPDYDPASCSASFSGSWEKRTELWMFRLPREVTPRDLSSLSLDLSSVGTSHGPHRIGTFQAKKTAYDVFVETLPGSGQHALSCETRETAGAIIPLLPSRNGVKLSVPSEAVRRVIFLRLPDVTPKSSLSLPPAPASASRPPTLDGYSANRNNVSGSQTRGVAYGPPEADAAGVAQEAGAGKLPSKRKSGTSVSSPQRPGKKSKRSSK